MELNLDTLKSHGILSELTAKLEARPENTKETKKIISDLKGVNLHLLRLQEWYDYKDEKLTKTELENDRNDMILTSYQRKIRVLEKELNEIKTVLYDSI